MSDILIRTVPVKLDVEASGPALVETARRFNAAATWIARVCWDEGITNTNTAHHRVYGQTRADYGLGAQLAVCARAKAMEAIKAVRRTGGGACPAWRADAAVRYDARTYRLLPLDSVSLNTVEGRVTGRLLPGQRQRAMLLDTSWRLGGADLVRRKGVWYLHLTQHRPAPELDEPTGYIGVDLGVTRIATTDDGTTFDGAQVTAVRDRRFRHRQRLQKRDTRRGRARLRTVAKKEARDFRLRRKLQAKGTKSAKRHLRKLSGRTARRRRDHDHVVSRRIVDGVPEGATIAVENLTNIRSRVKAKRANGNQRRLHSWSFAILKGYIAYKAEERGIRVEGIDPRHTSQTCSRCGFQHRSNRHSQSEFHCRSCSYQTNADRNGAINIGLKLLASRGLTAAGGPPSIGLSRPTPVEAQAVCFS